ncbi:hypothetical protein F443_07247 [Phytophthora nicotianae P1569]|uniref:Uncharacterized protein n=1 Tax=Phytophthora nicotianae P1569 TaxID=1317065 RepID=V9FBD9_PHYNI|nr:hypothetical protein F443_07247 [Phytophthora nicotianae P1569]
MMKLFSAIVGAAGSSFRVDIDASLSLFLAKKVKGTEVWLTEKDVKEGDNGTSYLKLLDVAGAPLNLVVLLEENVRFRVMKEDVKEFRSRGCGGS